jgi:hypothetical protein
MVKQQTYLKTKPAYFAARGRWHGQLIKILSADLFWVLVISGIIRLIYYSVLLDTRAVDTPSYINYSANILTGETERLRTPFYPYFIKLIGLFGQQDLISHVTAVQILISFLTIIPFYKTVQIVFQKRAVVIAASLLYGVMLPVINFDKIIITESLSVCFIVSIIYLIVNYLHQPKHSKAVLLSLSVFFVIMLRPSFIYLVPLLLLFWLLRLIIQKKERRTSISGLGALILTILLLAGYSGLNQRNFGFNGISVVSNNNEMAIMINTGMYMNGNDPEISAAIKNNQVQVQKKPIQQDSLINIMVKYDPERVHRFLVNCIKNQPVAYLKHIYGTLNNLQTENIFTNYALHKHNTLAFSTEKIEYAVFRVNFRALYLFLGLDFILIAVQWIRSKKLPWFRVILWLLITGQIAVAILGGYSEYQRLILAAIPGLVILLFSYIDRLSIWLISRRKTF